MEVGGLSRSEAGKAMKIWRRALGLSQKEMADVLDVPHAIWVAFERGRGLDAEVVPHIAQILGMDLRLNTETPTPRNCIRPGLENVTWETLRGKRFPNVWELMAANRGIRNDKIHRPAGIPFSCERRVANPECQETLTSFPGALKVAVNWKRGGPNMTTLADTIRLARERLGLTQAQLAERAGCSRMTVIAIEGGQSARQRTLEAISAVLGMQLATTASAPLKAAPRTEVPVPRRFTGRLTLKEMMLVARIERATGRRVYN